MDNAPHANPRGRALLVAALALTVCAACSTAADGPSETEPSLVRASTSPVDTVGIEKADLYRTREVPGVVERRPERTVRSAWSGTFTKAHGIRTGKGVSKGALLGTVRACVAPARSAPSATGSPTGNTTTGPSEPQPATDTGTDGDASAPGCLPRWHTVRAPVAGTITAVADGDVAPGATVATVRPPGYVIRATVTDPTMLYDLMHQPPTGKTRILGGPAGFTVTYERRRYDPADGSVELVLSMPRDLRVVEGLRTSTAFVVSRRTAVPTLPLSAVQGTAGVGQVVVVQGDRSVVTPVTLGQHDGARVEVGGLPDGARVLRFPLASDFLVTP